MKSQVNHLANYVLEEERKLERLTVSASDYGTYSALLAARDRGQQDDSHNDWTYETGSAQLNLDSWANIPWVVVVGVAFVLVPFTRTFRSLSGVLTGCEIVDIRTVDDIPDDPAALALTTGSRPAA